jgi:hypothetical protein
LYVSINGAYALVGWNRHTFSLGPVGIPSHPGTNTYYVWAGSFGSRAFLPPLSIHVTTPDQTPTAVSAEGSGPTPYLDMRTISARLINAQGVTLCPPEGFQFTFRIVEGEQWAGFWNTETFELVDSLTLDAPTTNERVNATIAAFRAQPGEPERVVVQVTASDPQFAPVEVELTVLPPVGRACDHGHARYGDIRRYGDDCGEATVARWNDHFSAGELRSAVRSGTGLECGVRLHT